MTDLNIYLGVIMSAFVYFTFYSLACKFADIDRWTEYLAMFFVHPFLWAAMFVVLICNIIYHSIKTIYGKLRKVL